MPSSRGGFLSSAGQGDFARIWGFAKALADALSISRGPDAKNLPGYIKAVQKRCGVNNARYRQIAILPRSRSS
jgi:hypothetical protein